MNFDFHCTSFDWTGGPSEIGPGIARLAQAAESAGVRTLSFMDHFFQIGPVGPAEDPMLEAYTALGYVAALTKKLRMRVLVSGVTYRNPAILAKTVTTLDVLSQGRVELGIGAAWYEREHTGLGVPFPPISERFERLEEALQICLQMWSTNSGPFEGKHYQLGETICSPAPVSEPRPRIMIGGGGERKTLLLVARYADACNINGSPDTVAHKIEVLRRHCDTERRNIGDIEITSFLQPQPDWTADHLAANAQAYANLGVATVMGSGMGASPVSAIEALYGPAIERIKEIKPKAL